MKKLIGSIIVTGLLSSPVFAAGDHQHDQHQQTKSSGSGMMDQQQMMKMHQHMDEMRELMGKIHKEEDPDKKQALMEQHMNSMHEGMNMMNEKMHGKMHGKSGMSNMPAMKMEDRMAQIEQRMDMMQKMMGEMAEHQVVETKSTRRKYKR